jgi:hypothetical protein
LQKRLFYTAKVPILQRKTGAFAKPNNCNDFSYVFSLQNKPDIIGFSSCIFLSAIVRNIERAKDYIPALYW